MTDTAEKRPLSNLVQRVLTGLVGMPLVIGVLYLGGWWFGGLMLALIGLAQYEFYHLITPKLSRRHLFSGLLIGAIIVLYQSGFALATVIVTVILIVLLMIDGLDAGTDTGWANFAWMIAGVFYPAWLFSFGIQLRSGWEGVLTNQESFSLIVGLVVMVWVTDTMAYFVGRSIGKTPLAPRISPKKTWEGTIGGFLGAVAAAVLLKMFLLDFLSWIDILVCAVIGGAGSQVGDLVESRLKRTFAVKDSGHILPGHGGILDRIDGLILALPLYYLYLSQFGGFL